MAQHTTMDRPSHTPRTPKGEELYRPVARRRTREAGDASGINPEDRKPIHPKMPHLPPA